MTQPLQRALIAPKRTERLPRVFGLMFASAVLLLTAAWADGALANRNKRGLRVLSIEGVLRLQEEDVDLGTAALILSRDWGTRQTLHAYRRKIDDMAETLQKQLKEKNIPTDHRALPIINTYLFEELGFRTVQTADDPEDLFLHIVLDRRRGYCLSLSILYLAIAERLGLPMYGVVAPGHFFVRYDDGRVRYNIETTSQGAFVEDSYYLDKFKPPNRPNSLYMKNLTRRQTLGCFYNNLGNSYSQVGLQDAAFAALQRAVQLAPHLGEAHTNLGNIYLHRQQHRQAIASYEQALALLGQDVITFNNMGTAWLQLKDYRKAESSLKTALSLNPDYTETYRNLALVYLSQGMTDKAVAQLNTAIAVKPQEAQTYLLLGQVYRQAEDLLAARQHFETALALSVDLIEARLGLGSIHLARNEAEQAIMTFQTALAWSPQSAQAYFGLAQAYHLLGQIDSEIWAYEQALQIDPTMTGAIQNLGKAWMALEHYDTAADLYQQAIVIDPANAALYYNLGVAMARQDLHEKAIASFLAAVELEPTNGAAFNGLAISCYQLKHYDLAYQYARKAQSLGVEVQNALLQNQF